MNIKIVLFFQNTTITNIKENNLGILFYIRHVNLICIKSHITFLILLECKPGFLGIDCLQTCGENFYGKLCDNKCDCNETQICHHACGCLRICSMTNDSSTAENVTSSYIAEACSISMNAVLTSQGINYCSIFSFINLIDMQRYFCHLVISFFSATINKAFNVAQPKKGMCIETCIL